MQKAYFLLVLAAGMLSLSGCAGPNINDPHGTTAESVSLSQAPAVAAAVPANSSSSASEASQQEKDVLPQMIYMRDTCMTSTGRTAVVTCGTEDGTIEVLVPPTERPAENGQANFDCQGSSYISLADGAAAVHLDGSYILFLADDTVEYHGIYKKKSDVSEDTLKWLDFYYSLPESGRDALSMVPSEFAGEMFPSAAVAETDAGNISYLDALTEEEVLQTEALAQQYFIEDAPMFEGVDQIYPVAADTTLYGNAGLEGEYSLGNIIIYKVLTVKDRRDGNPFRFISIARNSKSDDWKVINCGY